jgi:hypothetical protein
MVTGPAGSGSERLAANGRMIAEHMRADAAAQDFTALFALRNWPQTVAKLHAAGGRGGIHGR